MTNAEWKKVLVEMLKLYHKRNIPKIADKLIRKASSVVGSMRSRSKKFGVKCDITKDEILDLIHSQYGLKCPYDNNRVLDHTNMVFDHIYPISLGGESTETNIQVISRFSNNVKGNFTDGEMLYLLSTLRLLPDSIHKKVLVRLARGGRA